LRREERVELARESPFALGSMEVRPASREIVIAGRLQILQPRVMQVLVALARTHGEVVSRDELVMSCWAGRSVSEDAINRCIGALRRLSEEQDGRNFSIETIAKVGYRLAATPDESSSGTSAPVPRAGLSIAVLPFVNMSSDPEQEYLSDGLAEELISQLTQLRELRVAGRTSSFAFKGLNADLRTIGQKLGVAHILEGSVRKSGRRLKITAQLANCSDGYHLWSQTYDRELDDVFAIQESVAHAVTSALGVTLGVGSQSLDYGGTRSFAAFDHFLKGRLMPGISVSSDEFKTRLAHLRQAVAIDPDYALAWASRADLLSFHQNFMPVEEATSFDDEREESANRALALAPDLRAAMLAEGWRQADKRNWLAADTALVKVVAAGRGCEPYIDGIVGACFANMGRLHESLLYRTKARDADPLWIGWSMHYLGSVYTLEMWDSFDAEYERSLELSGDRSGIEHLRLFRLMQTGAPRAAIRAQFERMLTLAPWQIIEQIAAVFESREQVLRLLDANIDGPPHYLFMLAEYAGIYGAVDLALKAITKALPDTRLVLVQQLWRPELKAVRQDPRFKPLLRDLGLYDFWRKSGKWGEFARPSGDDDFEIIR
jgi:TolB-like protein/tetratricopeptide (TPR) repeat protein